MSDATPILSRLADQEFVDRNVELAKIAHFAEAREPGSVALLLGPARAGKSEILRKSFDRLFNKRGEVIPFLFALRPSCLDPAKFARDYFAELLAQLAAFRRNDPRLIFAAGKPLEVIARSAPSEDYAWMRSAVDSFIRARQSGNTLALLRVALRAPIAAAASAHLKPLFMIDNWHLVEGNELHTEFLRLLETAGQPRAVCVFSGLSRLITRMIPPEQDLFDRLEMIRVEKIDEESLEHFIHHRAGILGIETSDSTVELMIQQLDRDFFYTRAIIDAAASSGSPLKTFIDFERLYTAEVLRGRIAQYLDALLADAVSDSRARRAVLEVLALVTEAGSPVPIDVVTERIAASASDTEAVLWKLHSRELLDISYGFVSSSRDPVLADYVRAKYRAEIIGAPRPAAGEELLGEKLKQSHRLMMSRFNRQVQLQLVELLSRFDFQNLPASLFDHVAHEKRYRGLSRVAVRRALEDEPERVRLPQVVLVHDLAAGERPGVSWRLFSATGFEGGIHTEASEVTWLIALINSKEPLDVETLGYIDHQLESTLRGRSAPLQPVRWYISKEGFSALASERLSSLGAHCSTYSHLDLIQDYLTSLALGGETRPSSEFELVIPFKDEAELIAARTAEQIARAADFDQEAINQIKTALIEACINAAEHSDSPDKKIYQRFAIDGDKLIITVSNKGKTFGRALEQSPPSVAAPPAKGARGRGLQIIRALMDEVRFEPTDDGTRLVMIKYLKRPSSD